MAKLVHLCTKCEHPEGHHRRTVDEARVTGCSCCRGAAFDPNPEPTITPTFAYPSGEPEPLFEPGTVRNHHSAAHRETLCACDRCRAIYAREAG